MRQTILIIGSDAKVQEELAKRFPLTNVKYTPQFDVFNETLLADNVIAIVMHMTENDDVMFVDLLQTAYTDIPKFAVVAAAAAGRDDEDDSIARFEKAVRCGAHSTVQEPVNYDDFAETIRTVLKKRSTLPPGKEPVAHSEVLDVVSDSDRNDPPSELSDPRG